MDGKLLIQFGGANANNTRPRTNTAILSRALLFFDERVAVGIFI
jgi:hypothetical protein